MAAHEAPAAVHDHIATDSMRQRATELVAAFDAHHVATDDPDPEGHMDQYAWLQWEGRAAAILREIARG